MTTNENAKKYNHIKHLFFPINIIFNAALLLFIMFSSLSFLFYSVASWVGSNTFLINAIYCLLFCFFMYWANMPLSIYLGFILEHEYSLSNQRFNTWLVDDLKKAAIGFIVFLILVEAAYFIISIYAKWWIPVGIIWFFITFILAKVTPNILIPLFYKYSDIENQELKDDIRKLFDKCNLALKDVYCINLSKDTKKANAFVCGIGKSRRVVLSDTLLENFDNEEIKAVVAHELGHYVHQDIIKLLTVNAVAIFGGLYFVDIALKRFMLSFGSHNMPEIIFLPLAILLLMAFGLVTTPFVSSFSRFLEKNADRFSIAMTKQPQKFISMMEKLGKLNYAEFDPNIMVEIFLYDHPPISKRIAFAEKYLS